MLANMQDDKGFGGPEKNLGDVMDKKKVPTNHMNPKTLFSNKVNFKK